MNFNFGDILTRAWKTIWNHKVLWIFGILASCSQSNGGGSGGGGNSRFDTSSSSTDLPPWLLQAVQTFADNITKYLLIGLAIICVFWIATVFLSTIGRIGLIRGTYQVEGGAEALIFGQLFSESVPFFWRVFGLSLLVSLPVVIIAMLAAALGVLGVIAAVGNGSSDAALSMLGIVPILIGCICVFIPVVFVVGLIFRQAERVVVLDDMQVFPALSRGWEIFRANLGPILVMAIILVVINAAVGFVIALPVIAIVFPAALAYGVSGGESSFPLLFGAVCFCLFIPVAWLVKGVTVGYVESAWTLTYMELTKSNENAPIVLEENA